MAIISMSCRFPDAESVEKYWSNLIDGKDHFQNIPAGRKSQFDFSGIKTDKGSFLRRPYDFDHVYFNISEEEATAMDPQQRILLELVEEVKIKKGYKVFPHKNIGIYIGANQRAYMESINAAFYRKQSLDKIRQGEFFQKLDHNQQSAFEKELAQLEALPSFDDSLITGNISNMIAGRISHCYNLQGPSLVVDTACSSSLVAVHLACEALKNNSCDLAMAGGVNLNLTPSIFRLMQEAKVISNRGISSPFSKDSDGILLGEGAGLILLKRMEDAIKDDDEILAVIKGSGTNNDGKSLGIMAPSWKSQLNLLEDIYKRFDYDRSKISYIEAHGTSTRIGDSIEITVLEKFLQEVPHTVSVGSAKANIGHLLAASGMAGLIKSILCIQHNRLVGNLEGHEVNPKWDLEKKGLKIQKKTDDWNPKGVRAIGVNSFGFGGTNAHIILEEASSKHKKSKNEATPQLFKRKRLLYNLFPKVSQNDNHHYRLVWKKEESHQLASSFQPDQWILFSEKGSAEWERFLNENNHPFIVASQGSEFTRKTKNEFRFNKYEREQLDWFFQSLDPEKTYGILYLPEKLKSINEDITLDELNFVKDLFTCMTQRDKLRFWCICQGAQSVGQKEIASPYFHALYSLVSAGLNENTQLLGGLIDIENLAETNVRKIFDEMMKEHKSPLVLRQAQKYIQLLQAITSNDSSGLSTRINEHGQYLIIGGSSGIGAKLSLHLINEFSSTVVITGTRPKNELADELKSSLGNQLIYRQNDVTDSYAAKSMIDELVKLYGQFDGLIFCVGQMDHSLLKNADASSFQNVLRSKIKGVSNVYHALENHSFKFVYLMSSISALTPNWSLGLSSYAAANSYLDAVAKNYDHSQTKWISRSWGPWSNIGMSKSIDFSDVSLTPMESAKGLNEFMRSIHVSDTHSIVICPEDVSGYNHEWRKKRTTIKIRDSVQDKSIEVNKGEVDFVFILRQMISEAAEIPIAEIDNKIPFTDIGLDSINALDIIAQIENDYNFSLSPTLLFEKDSIDKLAGYLHSLIEEVKDEEKEEGFALLDTQKAFYTNQRLFENSACNIQVCCEIKTSFDAPQLQRVWKQLVDRHQSLRLSFHMTNDGPIQKDMVSSYDIEFHDLSNDKDVSSTIKGKQKTLLNKVYEIDRSPLYDFCCYKTAEDQAYLIFNAHHIILDGWSIALLLKDFFEEYTKQRNEELLQKPKKFSAYVDHMMANYSKVKKEAALDFWKIKLADYVPIQLSKKYRGVHQVEKNKTFTGSIKGKKLEELKQQAKQHGVTLFQMLLSAYVALIGKTTRREEVCVRMANMNRRRSFTGIQNLTGCFADSLPIRIQLNKDDDLIALSKRAKTSISSANRHSHVSSLDLASVLSNKETKSLTPFGISYMNFDFFKGGVKHLVNDVDCSAALPFSELSLICIKLNNEIKLSWNYQEDNIASSYVEKFHHDLLQILDGQSIGQHKSREACANALELPEQILYPNKVLLHQKVFAACDKYQSKIAIVDQKKQINFQALKAKSIRISNAIIESGDHSNDLIGVLGIPDVDIISGMIAILSSGCAYVPLDAGWPVGRIRDIIEHARIKVLLTSSEYVSRIQDEKDIQNKLSKIYLCDDPKWHGIDTPIQAEHQKDIDGDSLAYVMYTSGTTGIPKGVMVTHQSFEIFISWISEEFGIDENDRFIQTSSIGFGGSLRQIFSTLLAGGEIHPIDRYDFKDPKALLEFLEEKQITIFNTVPTVLQNINQYVQEFRTKDDVKLLTKLRLMLIGGEILHAKTIVQWRKNFGHHQDIFNLYGSTETIVNATFHLIPNSITEHDLIPIGTARKGSHVLLLNEEMELCKINEKGILYVGGPSKAEGYFRDDKISREKFIQLEETYATGLYYKTGDISYLNDENQYIFIGRNDDQIQLYGNRVEPAEIEAQIYMLSEIKRAAVIPISENDKTILVACIERESSDIQINQESIYAHLTHQLPSYMIPHRIDIMKELPLTHAGKIDRKGLLKILQKQKQAVGASPISTNSEQTITQIWERVLKKEIHSTTIDFFQVGGDSISALEVLHHLRKAYKNTPKPIELFRNRSIQQIASLMDRINATDRNSIAKNGSIASTPTSFNGKYVLSSTQKAFVFQKRRYPDQSLNMVAAIPVDGVFDAKLVRKTFNEIYKRHASFRTRFIKENKSTYQEVLTDQDFEFAIYDHIGIGETEQRKIIQKSIEVYQDKVFNLSEAPLFDFEVHVTHPHRFTFIFCIHHIIADAWSLKIITDEWQIIYDQLLKKQELGLAPIASSFIQYAQLEEDQRIREANKTTKELEFWKKSFDLLPRNKIHPSTKQDSIEKTTQLGQADLKLLKQFCGIHKISLFQLIFTIYAKEIVSNFNEQNILINSSIGGRDSELEDIEKVVGCFAKSIPVVLHFSSTDLLKQVDELKHSFYNSLEHQHCSPPEILKMYLSGQGRSMDRFLKYFISFMDFGTEENKQDSSLTFLWEDAEFYANTGGTETALMLGVRIQKGIHFNLQGTADVAIKTKILKSIKEELTEISVKQRNDKAQKLSSKQETLDAALIAYFPSSHQFKELLGSSQLNPKDILSKIFVDGKAQLLEVTQTKIGKTGTVFLPYFADEINNIKQETLVESVNQAVQVCLDNGAKKISLAGMIPSKTNFCHALISNGESNGSSSSDQMLTTGHSCTVVAVVKNTERVLQSLGLEMKQLKVAIVGFGSIGQASLNLLLSKLGIPKQLDLVERSAQVKALEKSVNKIKEDFGIDINVIPVGKNMSAKVYEADLIIGASSQGNILEVDEFKPGCILVDDSFPHVVSPLLAINRMKKKKDVLIVGGGKLHVGETKASIMPGPIPKSIIEKAILKMGNEGLPGCRLESLMMSHDEELVGTIGLVNQEQAGKFYDKVDQLGIKAVSLHLQGYQIENALIENMRKIWGEDE